MYLDDILIYTKDPSQLHVDIVGSILEQFWRYSLYTNLKKCEFYEDEVQFLSIVVLANKIKMEEKKIETIKNWPELKLVINIQMF